MDLNIPKNEVELQCAILDILKISDKLHKEILHRDIRWENVIKLTNGKWMLIDFEGVPRIGETR